MLARYKLVKFCYGSHSFNINTIASVRIMVAILYAWEKKECLAVHETFHNHEIVNAAAACTIGCGSSQLIIEARI